MFGEIIHKLYHELFRQTQFRCDLISLIILEQCTFLYIHVNINKLYINLETLISTTNRHELLRTPILDIYTHIRNQIQKYKIQYEYLLAQKVYDEDRPQFKI